MSYEPKLFEKIRKYLNQFPELEIEEKFMFGGIAFMVNGKMCVNVSGQKLMCRFDPSLTKELEVKTGFLPMTMNGKEYKGYCYVEPAGFRQSDDFEAWITISLDFNGQAKPSKK